MYVRVPSQVNGSGASTVETKTAVMLVPHTSTTVDGGVGVVALVKHSTVLAPSAGTTGAVVRSTLIV